MTRRSSFDRRCRFADQVAAEVAAAAAAAVVPVVLVVVVLRVAAAALDGWQRSSREPRGYDECGLPGNGPGWAERNRAMPEPCSRPYATPRGRTHGQGSRRPGDAVGGQADETTEGLQRHRVTGQLDEGLQIPPWQRERREWARGTEGLGPGSTLIIEDGKEDYSMRGMRRREEYRYKVMNRNTSVGEIRLCTSDNKDGKGSKGQVDATEERSINPGLLEEAQACKAKGRVD